MYKKIFKKEEILNGSTTEELTKEPNITKKEITKRIIYYTEIPDIIKKTLLVKGLEEIDYNSNKLIILSDTKEEYILDSEQLYIDSFIDGIQKNFDKQLNLSTPYLDMDFMIKVDEIEIERSTLTQEDVDYIENIKLRINLISHHVLDEKKDIMNIRINHVNKKLSQDDLLSLLSDENNNITNEAEKTFELLSSIISYNSKKNIIISGETGSGKTELQKLIIDQIPFNHKMIMIQDTRDTVIKKLYPTKDIIELFVDDNFTFNDAIKASLRQNPDYLCISEIRGKEAKAFFKALKTGHAGISTIHADSVNGTIYRIAEEISEPGSLSQKDAISQAIHLIDYIIYLEKLYYEEDGFLKSKRIIKEIGMMEKQKIKIIWNFDDNYNDIKEDTNDRINELKEEMI